MEAEGGSLAGGRIGKAELMREVDRHVGWASNEAQRTICLKKQVSMSLDQIELELERAMKIEDPASKTFVLALLERSTYSILGIARQIEVSRLADSALRTTMRAGGVIMVDATRRLDQIEEAIRHAEKSDDFGRPSRAEKLAERIGDLAVQAHEAQREAERRRLEAETDELINGPKPVRLTIAERLLGRHVPA